MIEKVNPSHPDKVADRIAGAIVDLAYEEEENPKVAVEVLIGHGHCAVFVESDIDFSDPENRVCVQTVVDRIAGEGVKLGLVSVKQDQRLACNQANGFRCGDNGIFRGTPTSLDEERGAGLARALYGRFPSDGKLIVDQRSRKIIICQSCADESAIRDALPDHYAKHGWNITVNPLGEWTGGPDVDAGATNRKLGSDMGRAATGGGLHGKDLSKADVSINIVCHLLAQERKRDVEAMCAIGDEAVTFRSSDRSEEQISFPEIVRRAGDYIRGLGGFEKFAEWGLI